jgi:predicted DNA-binding protein
MRRVSFDLSKSDADWLNARATAQGKSRAAVLREIVRWYIDKMEAGP